MGMLQVGLQKTCILSGENVFANKIIHNFSLYCVL